MVPQDAERGPHRDTGTLETRERLKKQQVPKNREEAEGEAVPAKDWVLSFRGDEENGGLIEVGRRLRGGGR